MAKKTLRVVIDGREFKRTTDRVYTYVLVGQQNEQKFLTYVNEWTKREEESHQEYIRHLQDRADGSWWTKNGFIFQNYDIKEQQRDIATLAKGSDTIREEAKASKRAEYERRKAEGVFVPHVVSWHGTLKAANAALKTASNRAWLTGLRLVAIADAQGPATIAPDATADDVSIALFGTR